MILLFIPKRIFIGSLSVLAALALVWLFTPAGWTPALAQDAPVHVVQPGETLSEIAKENNVSMGEIMTLNGITDADAIVVGQELRLPADVAPETPDAAVTPSTAITETIGISESVTAGETIPAPAADVDAAPTPSIPARDRAASLNQRYTVQFDDTIGLIALRAGVSEEAFRALNGLEDTNPADLAAGQVLLLPATDDDLKVTKAVATYVVQPGDALSVIANDNGLTTAELMEANGISDPNLVGVGQTLRIPPPTEEEEKKLPSSEVQVGPQRSGFYYYKVQAGDTLSEIARDFNTTKLALLEFNNLPDESTVYAGLDLRIPYGPPPLPLRQPPAPLSGTSFLVSLSRQECFLFEGALVKERWICSTGYGDWITRTGTFYVKTKMDSAPSSAYRLDMPYWLGLYDVGDFENGIHGLPVKWDTGEKLWSGLIGQPATFGCAMLDDPDAEALYNAAYLGMPVHVMQ
jgi:LysM repeat protein